jgi:hypothetical protein
MTKLLEKLLNKTKKGKNKMALGKVEKGPQPVELNRQRYNEGVTSPDASKVNVPEGKKGK